MNPAREKAVAVAVAAGHLGPAIAGGDEAVVIADPAPLDAEAHLGAYAEVVDRAIADGFAGARVAADITPLVADPAWNAAQLHWEQVTDRYLTEHPLAPVCLYDARRVSGIDAIICAHPLRGPSAASRCTARAKPRGPDRGLVRLPPPRLRPATCSRLVV